MQSDEEDDFDALHCLSFSELVDEPFLDFSNVEEGSKVLHTYKELFDSVHGGRMGHFGARKSWLALNKYFPGHGMPYRLIEDFVAMCAICQKNRLGRVDYLLPIYRTLKADDRRKIVSIDSLRITPADKYGNSYLNVIVVGASKLVALYPQKEHNALLTAQCLFTFFSTYGVYEILMSDPGSDLTSEVVDHLTKWFGIRHVFSLVDRHESNGVEGSNKQVLRHIIALCADERVVDTWSESTNVGLVQYILNSEVNSETGMSPFHAHFGSDEQTHMRLPKDASVKENAHAYVKLLDSTLKSLWKTSLEYQAGIVKKRTGGDSAEKQNKYQPTDLVLFALDTTKPKPSKLTMRFSGPYEVINQQKNDVQCRHLVMHTVHTFHVTRLKLYSGTREDADKVAQLDRDQYVIDKILYCRGNPMQRTTMEFFIRFADQEEKWVTWTVDLFSSGPYETFCRTHSRLFPLIWDVRGARAQIKTINKTAITEVSPRDSFFLDIRFFGPGEWYQSLGLPDCDRLTYVLPCEYTEYNSSHKKIGFSCELTSESFVWNHFNVRSYGLCTASDAENMVLVTEDLIAAYPAIKPAQPRAQAAGPSPLLVASISPHTRR
jgi:hypothetical protein